MVSSASILRYRDRGPAWRGGSRAALDPGRVRLTGMRAPTVAEVAPSFHLPMGSSGRDRKAPDREQHHRSVSTDADWVEA